MKRNTLPYTIANLTTTIIIVLNAIMLFRYGPTTLNFIVIVLTLPVNIYLLTRPLK